uniref:Uncharacterized protein n=1 Tax=Lepeophtheirus salmonis TaxID=72036 RepID=A0A0K2UID4_LEPSM
MYRVFLDYAQKLCRQHFVAGNFALMRFAPFLFFLIMDSNFIIVLVILII